MQWVRLGDKTSDTYLSVSEMEGTVGTGANWEHLLSATPTWLLAGVEHAGPARPEPPVSQEVGNPDPTAPQR